MLLDPVAKFISLFNSCPVCHKKLKLVFYPHEYDFYFNISLLHTVKNVLVNLKPGTNTFISRRTFSESPYAHM